MEIYTDPGHGWAKVSVHRLIEWGVAHKISPYSRRNGDYAFLEEDCDAPLAFAAFEKANGRPPKRTVHNTDQDSRVRNYRSFYVSVSDQARSEENEK